MPVRRPMTPADIRRQVVVEELDLSVDGRVAIVVRRAVARDRYVSHLYAIPLDRGRVARPIRLTSGIVRDTRPRICPDGCTIAFVRADPLDDDAPAALAAVVLDRDTMRVRGAVRVTRPRGHGAIGELAWSPDGRRLAFTAEVDPPRFLVGDVPPVDGRGRGRERRRGTAGTATAAAAPTPLARRITRADWRWDGEGHVDRWSHLFVLDGPGRDRPRQVTAGDWGVSDIAWHPDGRTVAFTTDRGPDADIRPRSTIWAVDVDGGDPREVLAPRGWANRPAWSPDGGWLAAVGVLEPEPLDDVSPGILLGPSDGSGRPRALAPELDRPIGNWVDTDLNGWMVTGRSGPFWLDERTILATVSDRGRSHPRRFAIDPRTGRASDPPRPIPATEIGAWPASSTHTLAVAGGVVAALGTLGTRAMELMTLDADVDGRPAFTTRSTFGSAWQRRLEPIEMCPIVVAGPAGPIETWIASPPGTAGRRLPTVIDIHGGPLGAWAPAPHIEVMLLVGRGYRVVLPNIRGSATYGRDWIRAQLGDWGGADADDVHAVVDHVVAAGLADPDRLGVLGLSYGGFMVNWLVGTTDRFRAAVSENGVTNQVSDWANSDGGPEFVRAASMGDVVSEAGVAKLWRQSPLRNVAAIRTPLLMLQAEADLRCPPHDNEQLFVALRHLGRTVEYVLYPDESHVFGSSGRPDRRVDRNERILAWFDRHLAG